MKIPQRRTNKSLEDKDLEAKIMSKYTKDNPQPQNLKERVELELKKLNK